ncbi:Chitin-binding type-4 domain-containing protein [Durusdinium trenchii]|uniref:Chitin-binding type-4 domain-containing protein n=1 Tax=Durusdinium trenchii TaxID=1381693 RepID=A0ABP0HVG4_9DINO
MKWSTVFAIVAVSAAANVDPSRGHGYLASPRPRSIVRNGGSFGPGDIQSLSGGGPALDRIQGHGLCGDNSQRRQFETTGPIQATFTEGSTIDIQVEITAHHWGWFEFRLANLDEAGTLTQDALNEHVLEFDEAFTLSQHNGEMRTGHSSPADYRGDPSVYSIEHAKCQYLIGSPDGSCCNNGGACSDGNNNKHRWMLPDPQKRPNKSYTMRYKLPQGVTCNNCVLQWYYQTGNSIDGYPEGFWNCADIRVVAGDGSVPAPSPTTQPPVESPVATPTAPPVASPTPPPQSGGTGRCGSTGLNSAVTDAWCIATGCAPVYVNAGLCATSAAGGATQPPTAQPPTTQPPTTQPPTTKPPTTQPPTTATATQPPTTRPPTTQPPAGGPTSCNEKARCVSTGVHPGVGTSWCRATGCAMVYQMARYCEVLADCPGGSAPEDPLPTPPPVSTQPPVSQPTTNPPTTRPPATNPPTPNPPTTTPPTNAGGSSSSAAAQVFQVLDSQSFKLDNSVLTFETPQGSKLPSTLYKSNDLVAAVRVMHGQGAGGFKLDLGFDDEGPDAAMYGLVNIAAFLAQSMKETIKYDACSENSWDLVSGKYPISNSCGQLGQSYQDYTCSAEEAHMQCDVDPDMEIVATTNAKWYGAPGPLRCGPKSKYPTTGFWDYSAECNKPWANPPERCTAYEGQLAGKEVAGATANTAGRTDVEGCCWWGRGVIQTTGICNFGKLNYYLGARAAKEGRVAPFKDVDFCKDPEVICSSTKHPELKWVAGFFYWMSSVQTYKTAEFDYVKELREFVDSGMTGSTFIDKVSGIVNRGCPRTVCDTGPVDGLSERRSNFAKVLDVMVRNADVDSVLQDTSSSARDNVVDDNGSADTPAGGDSTGIVIGACVAGFVGLAAGMVAFKRKQEAARHATHSAPLELKAFVGQSNQVPQWSPRNQV